MIHPKLEEIKIVVVIKASPQEFLFHKIAALGKNLSEWNFFLPMEYEKNKNNMAWWVLAVEVLTCGIKECNPSEYLSWK